MVKIQKLKKVSNMQMKDKLTLNFFLPNLYKIIKLFKYFSLSYRWVFLCSSEDCVNPKMYENWDFCELVTQEDCMSEDQLILKEYCPATCDCSKYKKYPFK